MTVQIDDAGWGSLVGPTFIGAYRPETGEFIYDVVPLRFFKGELFLRQDYLRETTCVVQKLLGALRSDPDEPVEICTGTIFNEAARKLHHPLRRTKIEGPLQEAIEEVARDYLRGLGVRVDGLEPGANHFMACLDWVSEDFPRRESYVKTGWKSWPRKWRQVAKRRWQRKFEVGS